MDGNTWLAVQLPLVDSPSTSVPAAVPPRPRWLSFVDWLQTAVPRDPSSLPLTPPSWWRDVKVARPSEVQFYLGSSAWQTDLQDRSMKKDFGRGMLGSVHRWYTRLLLHSAVSELQKSKD